MQNDRIKNFDHIIHDISVQSTSELPISVNKKREKYRYRSFFTYISLLILSFCFSPDRSIPSLLVARQG